MTVVLAVLGTNVLVDVKRYNYTHERYDIEGMLLKPLRPSDDQYDPKEADFMVLNEYGREIEQWDDGFGPLWVYRESLGVTGVVRATSWEDAWEAVVDEIMDDADPEDPENFVDEEGNLPEGVYFRGSGVPSNPHRKSPLAQEDLNGSYLDLLTPELARQCRLTIYTIPEETNG